MGLSKEYTIGQINNFCKNTLYDNWDILVTEVGEDFVKGTMPVTYKTVQPARILHGGASCALAESLGSLASFLLIDREKQSIVGQNLHANYIRPAKEGETVFAKATIIHKGRRTHIWDIDITNSEGKLVSTIKLTNAVIEKST